MTLPSLCNKVVVLPTRKVIILFVQNATQKLFQEMISCHIDKTVEGNSCRVFEGKTWDELSSDYLMKNQS